MVENNTSKSLKCLRSDNGGEYFHKEFEYYCSSNDICRKNNIPMTPQENGVAKKMNGSIMEHARSMRLHAWLPLNMWVDAIITTIYLINRGPSTLLGFGI